MTTPDPRTDDELLELGRTIEHAGRAHHLGEITFAEGLARVHAADPQLSEYGLRSQLTAWRSAVSRYTALVDERRRAREGHRWNVTSAARANRRPPIRLSFTPRQAG